MWSPAQHRSEHFHQLILILLEHILRKTSDPDLKKTNSDGEFTTALGKLFQQLITLNVNNLHRILSLNMTV